MSARNASIPTGHMTILLFMCSGVCATFGGVSQAVPHNAAQVAVSDHLAVLIPRAIVADFRKGEKSREKISDLMAGGETMAALEAGIKV